MNLIKKYYNYCLTIFVAVVLSGCQMKLNNNRDVISSDNGENKPLCASSKTKLKLIWNDDPNQLKNIEEVKRLNLDCCSIINKSEKISGTNLGILQYGSTALLLATPLAPIATIGGGVIGGIGENFIPNKKSKYSESQKNYILCKKALKYQ